MILILTEPSDTHADQVAQKLRQRGAEFVRFDSAEFPSSAEVSLLYPRTGKMEAWLCAGGDRVDLNSLSAVWYRRPTPSIPHDDITDKLTRDYVQEECKIFMHDSWNSLDCMWLPAPVPVIRRAELKASQLRLAASIGFEIPPTLFTNSPDEFLEFYHKHNGNIISKLPSSSLYRFTGLTFNRYTQVVSNRDAGYMRAIRLCPVIFQAYVPKQVELRITVVGRKIFAVEIHSQHSNHTKHDWRRYDRYGTRYLPHELPVDLELRCLKLVESLGLCYGAIDMVFTPDNRYVFLEINPNGQYLWVEQLTGLPISDAVCDLLLSGAKAGKPEVQPSTVCAD